MRSEDSYVDFDDIIPCDSKESTTLSIISQSFRTLKISELLLRKEAFRLSAEADKHVRFVAHLLSQICENAIFVYLGLFMFSNQYEWSTVLVLISIISCVLSRALMVVTICTLVWYINVLRIHFGCTKTVDQNYPNDGSDPLISRTATSLQKG